MSDWIHSELNATGPKDDILDFARKLKCRSPIPIALKDILDEHGINPNQKDYTLHFKEYYERALAGEFNKITADTHEINFSNLVPLPCESLVVLAGVYVPSDIGKNPTIIDRNKWRYDNWGSKSGMCNVDYNEYTNEIKRLQDTKHDKCTFTLHFDTVNTTPTEAFKYISRQFKDIDFTCYYLNETEGYGRVETYKGGKVEEPFLTYSMVDWYCYRYEDFFDVLDELTCQGNSDIIRDILYNAPSRIEDIIEDAKEYFTIEQIINGVNNFTETYDAIQKFSCKLLDYVNTSI